MLAEPVTTFATVLRLPHRCSDGSDDELALARTYHIPFRRWESSSGFTDEELDAFQRYLANNAPLIWDFAEGLCSQ